jgi:peptidoglycan LD-endopeptidase CwlK
MSARNNDALLLHPTFRRLDSDLAEAVLAAGLPIEPYEGWRDPNRQAYLFAEGRTPGIGTPGHHVTFEGAWESMHQYGLARDWVWWINNAWSWVPPAGHSWDEFQALAAKVGLVYLNFEKPHVQLPGVSARDILHGKVPYPVGGDDSWEENLETSIITWGRLPKVVNGQQNAGAPPLVTLRPLAAAA